MNLFCLSRWKNYGGWINFNDLKWENAGKSDLLSPGHVINKPGLLFEKIEDEEITRQVDKLLATKKANEAAGAKTTPGKEPVTFDDFYQNRYQNSNYS